MHFYYWFSDNVPSYIFVQAHTQLIFWNSAILVTLQFCLCLHYYSPLAVQSTLRVNSSRQSDAYMHQQNRPSVVKTMACCLFRTKPLPEPIMTFCQWDSLGFFSEISCEFHIFIPENWFENIVAKFQPFCHGLSARDVTTTVELTA